MVKSNILGKVLRWFPLERKVERQSALKLEDQNSSHVEDTKLKGGKDNNGSYSRKRISS